jgi:hypothetical protein
MSEKEIQQRILLALGALPFIRCWRQQSGMFFTATGQACPIGVIGCADLRGVMAPYGTVIEIEVKSETGRQSEQQKKYQAMITAMGGHYLLVRSVKDCIERIERIHASLTERTTALPVSDSSTPICSDGMGGIPGRQG